MRHFKLRWFATYAGFRRRRSRVAPSHKIHFLQHLNAWICYARCSLTASSLHGERDASAHDHTTWFAWRRICISRRANTRSRCACTRTAQNLRGRHTMRGV